jgi:hypothetical protein
MPVITVRARTTREQNRWNLCVPATSSDALALPRSSTRFEDNCLSKICSVSNHRQRRDPNKQTVNHLVHFQIRITSYKSLRIVAGSGSGVALDKHCSLGSFQAAHFSFAAYTILYLPKGLACMSEVDSSRPFDCVFELREANHQLPSINHSPSYVENRQPGSAAYTILYLPKEPKYTSDVDSSSLFDCVFERRSISYQA